MTNDDRIELASMNMEINRWFKRRQLEAMLNPPTGILFDDKVEEWLERPEVRSFESDLFRRLCIGYTMMREDYEGGCVLDVEMTPELTMLLESSLMQKKKCHGCRPNAYERYILATGFIKVAIAKGGRSV